MRFAAAFLLIPMLGAAQDRSNPTFRTETRLVQVSVVVHDKNGPVSNLGKDDFLITDRGKPRTIAVFSSSISAAPVRSPAALPANTFSNQLPVMSNGSRGSANPTNAVTVILLDGMNSLNFSTNGWAPLMDTLRTDTMSLAFARQQVMKFVKDIEPEDRVAIYSLGSSLHVLCDFTNDSAALQRILAAYRPIPASNGDEVQPTPSTLPVPGDFNERVDAGNQKEAGLVNGTRAGVTIDALRSIADHVAGIPGRKSLIWLTASMPFPGSTAARILSQANVAVYPVDARGLTTSFNPHVSQPGIASGPDLAAGQGEMRELAEETGGKAYLNNNDLSGAIRKAIDDSAVTYTLGFYVDSSMLDGKFHEIRVRVKNEALEVRAPRGYYATLQARNSETAGQNSVDKIALSPLQAAEIHLLARVQRIHPPLSFSVSCAVDLRNVDLRSEGNTLTGVIELYVIQQNAGGQVLDKSRDKLDLHLTRDQYAAYLKSGVFFRKVVAEKSNVATVRVVAGDPRTRRMGSLIIPASAIR